MQVLMIVVKVVLTILVVGYGVMQVPIWRDARKSGWRAAIDFYSLISALTAALALIGIWG